MIDLSFLQPVQYFQVFLLEYLAFNLAIFLPCNLLQQNRSLPFHISSYFIRTTELLLLPVNPVHLYGWCMYLCMYQAISLTWGGNPNSRYLQQIIQVPSITNFFLEFYLTIAKKSVDCISSVVFLFLASLYFSLFF